MRNRLLHIPDESSRIGLAGCEMDDTKALFCRKHTHTKKLNGDATSGLEGQRRAAESSIYSAIGADGDIQITSNHQSGNHEENRMISPLFSACC